MGTKQTYVATVKPKLDILLVLISLPIVLPVLVIASLAILLSGYPILFMQLRPGLEGRSFRIYKLRTLKPGTVEPFKVGSVLRTTSIDELPQFLNILKGEMSLIGPRPLLLEYEGSFSERQKRRNTVRPGITGLAQVSGRNDLTLAEKLAFDVHYVDSVSFELDVLILLRTFAQIFKWRQSDFHSNYRKETT